MLLPVLKPVLENPLRNITGDAPAGDDYITDAVEFDGTNDGLTRASDLIGNADGKLGIISGWFRLNTFSNLDKIYIPASARINIESNNGFLRLRLSGTTGILRVTLQSLQALPLNAWIHILISWDFVNGIQAMYINDVINDSDSVTTVENIDYTSTTHYFGEFFAGNLLDGCVADYYYNNEQFLDITIEANRRRFISPGGKPVDLGLNGNLPTGSPPRILFKGNSASFQNNLGSGGAFTQLGAIANCPTSPTD